MAYRIFETEVFRRDLARLDPPARARIEQKLRRYVYPLLKESPRFGPSIKRLQGYEPPTWRWRVGEWRFFYAINEVERIVSMLAAEHRGRAYR